MTAKLRTFVGICTLVAVTSLLLSCAEAPEPDYSENVAELHRLFSYYSMLADYENAGEILDQLAEIPGMEADAAYGRNLLNVNGALGSFADLLNLVNIVADGLAPSAFETMAETGGLTDLLHGPAQKIRERFARMDEKLLETIDAYPDGSFEFDEFAFYTGNIPIIVMRGEFDRSDLELVLAASNIIQGAMALVQTVDLGMKVTDIFTLLEWFDSKHYCKPSWFDDKRCLLKFGAYALERFPDMFALAPGGAEASLDSLDDLVTGIQHFLNYVDLAQTEDDDQGDDIFIVEHNISTTGDIEDTYTIGMQNFRLPTRDVFLQDTIGAKRHMVVVPSGWSQGSTRLSQTSMDIIEKLGGHLDGDGSRMDLQDFLRPMIEMLLKTLITTNAIDDGYGPLSDVLANFRNLGTQGIDATDFVISLMDDVIPLGMIEFDLYGLLTEGFALRSLLPHYDYMLPDDEEPILAMEWECGFDQTDTLVCRGSSTSEDSDHFVGYDYAFSADSNADDLPYFGFQDPGLSGRFYLDPSLAPQSANSTRLKGASGSKPADNRSLNYVIHRIWEFFYSALDKAGGVLSGAPSR